MKYVHNNHQILGRLFADIFHCRRRLNYAPCEYANTKCFNLGTKQAISTIDAVHLLLSVSPVIDPIAKEALF